MARLIQIDVWSCLACDGSRQPTNCSLGKRSKRSLPSPDHPPTPVLCEPSSSAAPGTVLLVPESALRDDGMRPGVWVWTSSMSLRFILGNQDKVHLKNKGHSCSGAPAVLWDPPVQTSTATRGSSQARGVAVSSAECGVHVASLLNPMLPLQGQCRGLPLLGVGFQPSGAFPFSRSHIRESK